MHEQPAEPDILQRNRSFEHQDEQLQDEAEEQDAAGNLHQGEPDR